MEKPRLGWDYSDNRMAEVAHIGGLTLSVRQEKYPEDPRKYHDHIGRMVCFHGRYSLGDEGHGLTPDMFSGWDELESHLWRKGAVVTRPLYLYDHGGLRMKIGDFYGLLPQGHAEFDSGQVGFAYVIGKEAREEMGWKKITRKRRERLREILASEVEEYDQYLSGQVYHYLVVDDQTGQVIDSCGGFYGDLEYVKCEAEDAADGIIARRAEREDQEHKATVAHDEARNPAPLVGTA